MAETYDPTPDDEPDEPVPAREEAPGADEPQYIIDPENEAWLWSIPAVAVLSFILVFAIRLNYIPSPFEDFVAVAVLEAVILLILLVVAILTTVER